MEQINCEHVDGQILYGKTVYKDATTHIVQHMHDMCGQVGTAYEQWSDSINDYAIISEQWHKPSDYYCAHEVDMQIIALTLQ